MTGVTDIYSIESHIHFADDQNVTKHLYNPYYRSNQRIKQQSNFRLYNGKTSTEN